MRYRKIDPRVWNDEEFTKFDPFEKLLWLTLLSHPLMTPMGAGVIYPGVLDAVLGNEGSWCFRCQHECEEPSKHTAERLLERFQETLLIYRDRNLLVIKNYLLYNAPDNPNQLVSWLASCEELPRSECFRDLYEHLQEALNGEPSWLFDGLLRPLAEGHNRLLLQEFWQRIGIERKPGRLSLKDLSGKVTGKVSGKVTGKVTRRVQENHPVNQEQEQYYKKSSLRSDFLESSLRSDSFFSETQTASSETPAEPPILTFPCDGEKAEWHLTRSHVAEWKLLFPSLDIEAECRHALAWVLALSSRRKTHKGMKKFLVGWFGNSQNGNRGNGNGSAPTGPSSRDRGTVQPGYDVHADLRRYAAEKNKRTEVTGSGPN